MNRECLFIAIHSGGVGYSDKNREKDGDYLRLCFLPYGTLVPQWTDAKMSDALRKEIEKEILSMQIHCGRRFETSATQQTVLLGGEAEPGLAIKSLMKRYPNLLPRDNCLQNMVCPSCGSREAFKIRMEVTMTLQDQGTEGDYGDSDWDENSYCQCTNCQAEGIADDFTFPGLDDAIGNHEPCGDQDLDLQG